jgi:hypothetical protein
VFDVPLKFSIIPRFVTPRVFWLQHDQTNIFSYHVRESLEYGNYNYLLLTCSWSVHLNMDYIFLLWPILDQTFKHMKVLKLWWLQLFVYQLEVERKTLFLSSMPSSWDDLLFLIRVIDVSVLTEYRLTWDGMAGPLGAKKPLLVFYSSQVHFFMCLQWLNTVDYLLIVKPVAINKLGIHCDCC